MIGAVTPGLRINQARATCARGTPRAIATAATVSLTATVTGTTTTGVAWAVDGVQNGNAAVGTITGTGNTVVYTAPAAAGAHAVTATSNALTT